jgi:hypothetical protein
MCRRDDDRPVAILTKREARSPRDQGERALRFSEHFLQTGDFNEVYLELEIPPGTMNAAIKRFFLRPVALHPRASNLPLGWHAEPWNAHRSVRLIDAPTELSE